ncbi:glycoside hydrolase family 3 protein [Alkalibaculum sp. M08DMB]|uniref:beta-N-acetylhexosaminidase n=1 Tax=Alkalibaculum sporogenes TaxID=2655001 RepID=A0A6A7KAJ6_9FIRM|nr:glycoside hydrolase family 3 N-terminal domain-containing protein [Alkalibaculum sporogenes]MPW26579.1 glycoside hydrolase family 3 protein [Alkalibaculum sporogenes]
MTNYNILSEKPFYLSDSDIQWVKKTYENMTLDEKVGQLFFLTGPATDKNYLNHATNDLKVGGLMCRVMDKDHVVESVAYLQRNSNIPMLIAANLEAGGNGIVTQGTKIGSQMAVAATNDTKYAYELGYICAVEAKSVGANYAFAPVVDIDYNFRNPITNTRTYGSNFKTVLAMASEYIKGCQSENVCVSIKHFPGDGVDERDQHLLTSINDMKCLEWDRSYGEIYKTLIDQGAKTVMVGHIMQPEYSKFFNPELRDEDILPASLSKELLGGLLRDKLGFNGLIITDATTMAGMNIPMKRDLLVPYSIAAGCDMFLFAKNLDEDYQFMMEGVKSGVISQERLEEAVMRILALKASIKLHASDNIPKIEEAEKVLSSDHAKKIAREVSDRSITLVKNLDNILPLDNKTIKNILVYELESGENALGYGREVRIADRLIELLKKEGINTVKFVPGERLEGKQTSYMEMVEEYDLMLYIANIATKSNQTTVRIEWMNPMGINCPIYINSIPTVFVSVENPYHLLDVPRIRTFINCYSRNDYTLELLVDKLFGRSEFTGKSPIDPFCGKWDTRL